MKKLYTTLFVVFVLMAFSYGQGSPPVSTTQLSLPVGTIVPDPIQSVSVQRTGNPGGTTYYYWIVGNFAVGSLTPAGPFIASSSADTLSGSRYNSIFVTFPSGVTSVDVLRTVVAAAPSGTCNCAVATGQTSSPINDQSNSLNAYTVAPFNLNSLGVTLTNEVVSSGASHLLLRQNGVLVADLSTSTSMGGSIFMSLDVINGGLARGWLDNLITQTWQIDASTGNANFNGSVSGVNFSGTASGTGFWDFLNGSAPSTPAVNRDRFYFKTGDNPAFLDSAGVETLFVTPTSSQSLSNKILLLPFIADFSNANHNHQNATGGGLLNVAAISTGIFGVPRGGTGLGSGTSGGMLCYTASGTLASSAALGAGQFVLGGGAGVCPTTSFSIVPVANGGTGLGSGTSGGIPAYTASGTLVSSAALGANLPVIGGGAGVAPSTGTRQGNTTAFATAAGAFTPGNDTKTDANGNIVDAGAPLQNAWIWGMCNGAIGAANATNYILFPFNGNAGLICTVSTGALEMPVPFNCTAKNLRATTRIAATTGITFKLFKNGSATALAAACATTTSCSDTSNTVALVAGTDVISIRVLTGQATETAQDMRASFQCQ